MGVGLECQEWVCLHGFGVGLLDLDLCVWFSELGLYAWGLGIRLSPWVCRWAFVLEVVCRYCVTRVLVWRQCS